ncbi:hypothetical protein [Flavobacterium sp. UGB4466]|uniref:hypothetical protein n=1 Tax=Flavobacterium sp. UGB4466 TaxID=2730889 RepID=UPI00192AA026|nr:hypothetical protein [Flavobacterium sp. UGB4466]
MSKENINTTAKTAVVLQGEYNAKLEVLNALPETATAEERLTAQTAHDEAKSLLDTELAKEIKPGDNTGKDKAKAPKAEKPKLVKGKFLLSPTGRFGLAYNAGESAELESKQAAELDEAGYFKIDSNS